MGSYSKCDCLYFQFWQRFHCPSAAFNSAIARLAFNLLNGRPVSSSRKSRFSVTSILIPSSSACADTTASPSLHPFCWYFATVSGAAFCQSIFGGRLRSRNRILSSSSTRFACSSCRIYRGSTTRRWFKFSRSSAQAGKSGIRLRPNIQTLVSRIIHSSRILTGRNFLTDLFQLQQNGFRPFVELPLSLETIAVSIRQRINITPETIDLHKI